MMDRGDDMDCALVRHKRPPMTAMLATNADHWRNHMENQPLTIETSLEFHRRMAAIIDAVQAGIWKAGLHHLLGYTSDYTSGEPHGLQTLILKSRSRSTYVRLQWDTILSDSATDRQLVDEAVEQAILQLG